MEGVFVHEGLERQEAGHVVCLVRGVQPLADAVFEKVGVRHGRIVHPNGVAERWCRPGCRRFRQLRSHGQRVEDEHGPRALDRLVVQHVAHRGLLARVYLDGEVAEQRVAIPGESKEIIDSRRGRCDM